MIFSPFSQAAIRRAQGSQENFSKVQGTMSEDEALARAIAASMQESHASPIAVGGDSASGHDKNKCAIS
jgi:hypothetical protein